MKKLSLVILLSLFLLPVYAEEEVFLDLGETEIRYLNTGKLKFENPEVEAAGNEERFLKPSDAFDSMWQMFKEDVLAGSEKQE